MRRTEVSYSIKEQIYFEKSMRRFWDSLTVDGNSDCYLWEGIKDVRGYGRFSFAGRNIPAHYYLWTQLYGNVPPRHELHHRCRKRECVNPDHLQLVQHSTHMKMHRASWMGEKNSNAKLTRNDVFEIRFLHDNGGVPGAGASIKELAEMFNVKERNIYSIIRWDSWDSAEMEPHNWERFKPEYYIYDLNYNSIMESIKQEILSNKSLTESQQAV